MVKFIWTNWCHFKSVQTWFLGKVTDLQISLHLKCPDLPTTVEAPLCTLALCVIVCVADKYQHHDRIVPSLLSKFAVHITILLWVIDRSRRKHVVLREHRRCLVQVFPWHLIQENFQVSSDEVFHVSVRWAYWQQLQGVISVALVGVTEIGIYND